MMSTYVGVELNWSGMNQDPLTSAHLGYKEEEKELLPVHREPTHTTYAPRHTTCYYVLVHSE